MNTYRVTFSPCKEIREDYGSFYETTIDFGTSNGMPSATFEAKNVDEILSKVEAIANEHGQSCAAFVRMIKGTRKPAGFDARVRGLRYNLIVEDKRSEAKQK